MESNWTAKALLGIEQESFCNYLLDIVLQQKSGDTDCAGSYVGAGFAEIDDHFEAADPVYRLATNEREPVPGLLIPGFGPLSFVPAGGTQRIRDCPVPRGPGILLYASALFRSPSEKGVSWGS